MPNGWLSRYLNQDVRLQKDRTRYQPTAPRSYGRKLQHTLCHSLPVRTAVLINTNRLLAFKKTSMWTGLHERESWMYVCLVVSRKSRTWWATCESTTEMHRLKKGTRKLRRSSLWRDWIMKQSHRQFLLRSYLEEEEEEEEEEKKKKKKKKKTVKLWKRKSDVNRV